MLRFTGFLCKDLAGRISRSVLAALGLIGFALFMLEPTVEGFVSSFQGCQTKGSHVDIYCESSFGDG